MQTNKDQMQPHPRRRSESALMRLVMFSRRIIYCSFGIHSYLRYECGKASDSGQTRTCTDCGYRTAGIKLPDLKMVKLGLRPPELPPCRTMKETLWGGLIETEESKQKTRDWYKNIRRNY